MPKKTITTTNNLAYLRPELLKRWCYELNTDATPEELTTGSNRKVWWLCENCNEPYLKSVKTVCKGEGCNKKQCYSTKISENNKLRAIEKGNTLDKDPLAIKFYHHERNSTPLKLLTKLSSETIYWRCPDCCYSWKETAFSATLHGKKRCPVCSDRITVKGLNDLYIMFPELRKEQSKNCDVELSLHNRFSTEIVTWNCKNCGEEWKGSIKKRIEKGSKKVCSNCVYKVSSFELEVREYINSLGVKFTINDRTILGGNLELDFHFKELALGLECNGNYWHSDIYRNGEVSIGKERHLRKLNLGAEAGVRVYFLWEFDWRDHREECEILLKSLLTEQFIDEDKIDFSLLMKLEY